MQHASPEHLVTGVHFWRHFAVLTVNPWVQSKQDHLFLVREGWLKRKSGKFKVVPLRGLFEIGTMAGLINIFSRHSEIWTNFRILYPESRHIGSRGQLCEPGTAGA